MMAGLKRTVVCTKISNFEGLTEYQMNKACHYQNKNDLLHRKMLTQRLTHLRAASQCVWQQARRNIGCTAVLAQKVDDPIQQLFIQKIREFAEKKK